MANPLYSNTSYFQHYSLSTEESTSLMTRRQNLSVGSSQPPSVQTRKLPLSASVPSALSQVSHERKPVHPIPMPASVFWLPCPHSVRHSALPFIIEKTRQLRLTFALTMRDWLHNLRQQPFPWCLWSHWMVLLSSQLRVKTSEPIRRHFPLRLHGFNSFHARLIVLPNVFFCSLLL